MQCTSCCTEIDSAARRGADGNNAMALLVHNQSTGVARGCHKQLLDAGDRLLLVPQLAAASATLAVDCIPCGLPSSFIIDLTSSLLLQVGIVAICILPAVVTHIMHAPVKTRRRRLLFHVPAQHACNQSIRVCCCTCMGCPAAAAVTLYLVL